MAALSLLFMTYKGEINLLQLRLMLMLVQTSLLEISVKANLVLDVTSCHWYAEKCISNCVSSSRVENLIGLKGDKDIKDGPRHPLPTILGTSSKYIRKIFGFLLGVQITVLLGSYFGTHQVKKVIFFREIIVVTASQGMTTGRQTSKSRNFRWVPK